MRKVNGAIYIRLHPNIVSVIEVAEAQVWYPYPRSDNVTKR